LIRLSLNLIFFKAEKEAAQKKLSDCISSWDAQKGVLEKTNEEMKQRLATLKKICYNAKSSIDAMT
jgi:chaperonin cofactor prefoldin